MSPPRVAWLFLLLSLAGCSRSTPPPPPRPVSSTHDEAIETGRRIVRALMKVAQIPGLQVSVRIGDDIAWSEAFGVADRERGTPATTKSRFRVASLSKNLTGTLLAKLVEEKKVDLDRPIGEWVKDLPPAWNAITLRELATHTSGIGHYQSEADAKDPADWPNLRAALAHFSDRPLLFAPGKGEQYSTYAYTLLGVALEEATGKPFDVLMKEEILDPLGMVDTVPDRRLEVMPTRTTYYEYSDSGKVIVSPYENFSGRWPGGGYLSTADELSRFGAAHTKPGLLSASSLYSLVARMPLPGGKKSKEGLGWGARSDWSSRREIWGNGITAGSTCGLLVYPDQKVTVALTTNVAGAPIDRGEFQAIALRFLADVEQRSAAPIPAAVLGDWNLTVSGANVPLAALLHLAPQTTPPAGTFSIARWQSFDLVDGWALADTTWLLGANRRTGMFPLRLTTRADSLFGDCPRAGLSFSGGHRGAGAPDR